MGVFRWLRRLVGCACFLFTAGALASGPGTGTATDQHSVLGERITSGLVSDGRLWLRNSAGILVSIDLRLAALTVPFNDGRVVDIATSGGQLWVLRTVERGSARVAVWRNGTFENVVTFEMPAGEALIGLVGKPDAPPLILCSAEVRVLAPDGKVSVIPLKGGLPARGQITSAAAPLDGSAIYVGFDRGEWGGGMQQIDLSTGSVKAVDRRDSSKLCAGPLNSECDPVTAIVPDTRDKSCVLASVGLRHLGVSEGRVLRVCRDSVDVFFQFAISENLAGRTLVMTEAIFDLVSAANGGTWAVTPRAVYRLNRSGSKVAEYPLPELKPVVGVPMSRTIPGVIVVRTDVNWAVSTSGYTPLVIADEANSSPSSR